MKGQNPIFMNALTFWIVKIIILVVIYLVLIAPNIENADPLLANFVNIAYAFLAIFVIFGMKLMRVGGLFSYRK